MGVNKSQISSVAFKEDTVDFELGAWKGKVRLMSDLGHLDVCISWLMSRTVQSWSACVKGA